MGIVSFDEETTSKVAPARLFKGLITDNHNLIPKIVPRFVKSAAIIQGDGEAGSIKLVTLGEDAPSTYLKYKVDEIDESQYSCKYTQFEGGKLGEAVKSITFENKLEPTPSGGCISKITRVFNVVDGAEVDPKEYEGVKVNSKMLYDAVEAYLLANPDVYA